jgi:hypothetical protein
MPQQTPTRRGNWETDIGWRHTSHATTRRQHNESIGGHFRGYALGSTGSDIWRC